MWAVSSMLQLLSPWQEPGTHYKGGWVDLRANLDSNENLILTGIWYLDHSALASYYTNCAIPAPNHDSRKPTTSVFHLIPFHYATQNNFIGKFITCQSIFNIQRKLLEYDSLLLINIYEVQNSSIS